MPDVLTLDNGPEFTSRLLADWCRENGVLIHHIQPGEPNRNACIEGFNRSYRNEALNLYLLCSLDEVREKTSRWIDAYCGQRPRDALAGLPPCVYATKARKNSGCELST